MGEFRQAIENNLRRTMPSSGVTLCSMEGGDHYGKIALKDGSTSLYAAIPSGVFSGSDLLEAARIAQSQEGALRLTVEQNLIITGIQDEAKALQSPLFAKYPNRPSPYMANLIACAGSDHCPFGVILGKSDAIAMGEYLSREIPLTDAKVRLYWSACIKGCGIHGAGDLGFVGCKVPRNGKTVLGVDIFIGGSLSGEGEEGKLLLKGIILDEAPQYVAELMHEYAAQSHPHESLETFILRLRARYTNPAIAFLMRWNRTERFHKREAFLHFNLHSHGGNHKEIDEIFTYGSDLIHTLTQKRPYETEDPFAEGKKGFAFAKNELTPDYAAYAPIIEKMVEPNPLKRFQVFTEIVTALTALSNGE